MAVRVPGRNPTQQSLFSSQRKQPRSADVFRASHGLFFRALDRIHTGFRTLALSLVVGTAIASVMLTLVLGKSLLDAFDWIVRLSLLTTLVPHLVVMAADFVLARRAMPPLAQADRRRATITAIIAFVFVAFTIYGLGPQAWLWGSLVLVVGVPLYFVLKRSPRVSSWDV
jgi:basic amino acid/polyamine antiporter, APA family